MDACFIGSTAAAAGVISRGARQAHTNEYASLSTRKSVYKF